MDFDGYAIWDAQTCELVVGNSAIVRRWRLGGEGRLRASSLIDPRAGKEWLGDTDGAPAARTAPEPGTVDFTCERDRDRLSATLTARGAGSRVAHRFEIRPGVAAVTQSVRYDGPAGGPSAQAAPLAVHESLALAPPRLRLTHAVFQDNTDRHNELLREFEWLLHPSERELRLQGCLFAFEDVLTGDGLTLLKQAPLPHARPRQTPVDLVVRARERSFALLGHGAEPGEGNWSYPWTVLLSGGGAAGRTAALQSFQRAVHPYRAGRDGLLLSNTWGDRNRDGRINASFVSDEIAAARELGVDVVQIDDGWQKGASSNSVNAQSAGGVWEGFYAADPDFWTVNRDRFPAGLQPLAARAAQLGVRLGLWFAPDSADDFLRWEQDAACLLKLNAEFGVEHFKIDGVKLRSKTGERNLHAFMDRVLDAGGGRIVFDLDVTAEVRPGYFGRLDGGPLFVENRYTDLHSYWPHATLRNLWRLAHYIVDREELRLSDAG